MASGAVSHIALLLPELEAGGAQRAMLLLARKFVDKGHRVDLVLLRATGPLLSVVPPAVRVVDLAKGRQSLAQSAFAIASTSRLMSWIRLEHPDALLSTITGANLVALVARRLARIPLRLVIREAAPVNRIGSRMRLVAMRWLYPQADAIIALTPTMAKDLVQHIGVSPTRIHCIPNPVDTAFVHEQARAPLAHAWLHEKCLPVIVSVGRLVPEKDFGTLLRAFSLLSQVFPARLVIVGEGPERATLEELTTRLGTADRVQLIGFDLNPWRWIARADLFVLSSRSEGSPNALIEALVLGVPSIVTEYDGSVRDLASRHHMSVVPTGKPETLACAMEDMLRTPSNRKGVIAEDMTRAIGDYLAALACAGL